MMQPTRALQVRLASLMGRSALPSCAGPVACLASAAAVTLQQRSVSSSGDGARDGVRPQRRQSRRRYTADNTRGRVAQAKELIDRMKSQNTSEAKAFFDTLQPRDKLDVMRLLHLKRTKRRRDRRGSALPRYRSKIFERRYYFREEDVSEQSTLGRGPGGQATNRRMQTVILTHHPSGLIVKFSRFPSLWLNRRAARELLNMRLEERLLGENSELGRAKAKKERRRQRNLARRERLVVRGAVLAARESQQRDFHGVLTGRAPLPPRAAEQLGMPARARPLSITDLFEDECQNWWPLLQHAFGECAAATSVGGGDAAVPLLLQYVFPVPEEMPGAVRATRAEQDSLARCREDAVAVANVRRSFQCFCELFGLRVATATKEDGTVQVALLRDGLNWLELGRRMLADDGQTVSPPVLAAWRHVHAGLCAMHMTAEARSVRVFFAREARAAERRGDGGGGWAAQARAALTH